MVEDTLGVLVDFGVFVRTLIILIDPDDLIFPRAATRIGTRYQANVPDEPVRGNTGKYVMIDIC